MVSKPFYGIFSDPEGGELTYSVSVPDELAAFVEYLEVPTNADLAQNPNSAEVMTRVWFRARPQADWGDIGPTLPNPLRFTVTLTATDPEGMSSSITGEFYTWWDPPIPPGTPLIDAVAVVSDAGDDQTYARGEVIRVRLTFSDAVEVTGSPQVSIDMDPANWGQKWATYESGSGTAELIFAYTVVEPNFSTQGIAVLADTLRLDGGAIQSADGIDADLSHSGLAHDPDHKVDWR